MADLHPSYPKEGADQQDAHTRVPRNYPAMVRSELAGTYNSIGKTLYNFNEKDESPETVGGKDPWAMSPNELRKYTK